MTQTRWMKAGLVVLLMVVMAIGSLLPGYCAGKDGVITGSSAHDKITLLEVADTPDPFSPELTNATFTGVFQVKRTDGLGSEDNEHPDKFRFFIRHTLIISDIRTYQEVTTLIGETNVIAPPKEKGKDGDKKYFSVTIAQLWNGLDAQGNIVIDSTYQYTLTGELYRENLKHKGGQDKEPKVKLIGASNSLGGTISVDTAPPVVSTIPAQNAVITEHTPVIVVNYTDASGVDLSTLKILFNNVDLTSQFSVTASQATYQIPEKLSDGLYTISVTIKDILGQGADLTTTFSIVSAMGVVTPAGGGTVVVTEPGSPLIGSAIEIPPGAVAEVVSAVISAPLSADVPPPPVGVTVAGPAIKLDTQPQITFTSPITIKVPYSESLVTAAGGNEANVKLIKFDTATNQWVNIPATVDTANNLLVAQVTSLSVFQAVIPTTQTVTKTEYGSIVEISGPVQMTVDTDYHIVLSATTSAPIYQWSLKQNGVVVDGQGFVFGNTLNKTKTFNKSVAGDYTYLLSFRGIMGAHGWPPYTVVTITVTVVPPNAPSDLVATAVSSSQIDIAWIDNSNNEQVFKIECKTEAPTDETKTEWQWTPYTQIATVGAGITSYSHTGLVSSRPYTYQVRVSTASADSDYSNEATAYTWPATPLNLTVAAVSHKELHLQWTNVSDHHTLVTEIERSIDNVNYTSIKTSGVPSTNTDDTWLDASVTYYYRARTSTYKCPQESDYSNIASATTLVLTIPEASARVTGLYNAQLITGTDLYNFLIDHLDQANTFYNSGNFNDAYAKVDETFYKILDGTGEGIEYVSAYWLGDYVSDLLADTGKKTTPEPSPEEKARKEITNKDKEAKKNIDNRNISETAKTALQQKIDNISSTGNASIELYGTKVTPTLPSVTCPIIAQWTIDRMTQVLSGTDRALTPTYTAGINIPGVISSTTGIHEIPRSTWQNPAPTSIGIGIRRIPDGTITPEVTAITTNSALTKKDKIDGKGTKEVTGTIDCYLENGRVCDLIYLKIEISDTGKGSPDKFKPIWGWKILIHLAD